MRKLLFSVMLLLLLAATAFAGDDHGAVGESHTIAVTQWTDQVELFMEYPLLATGQSGRCIIHLTVLDGFQPVREGSIRLLFAGTGERRYEFNASELLREGIFAPAIMIPEPGAYEFHLEYSGPDAAASFRIPHFIVYANPDAIPHATTEESAGEIRFLKEQQWKVPFATAETEIREIKRSIWAIGEILPSPNAYAEIIAPVDGIFQTAGDGTMALPGSLVSRGELLATLSSPLQGDGWVSSRLAYEQAKRNFERAERLIKLEAISKREFEEAENEFETRKAGFKNIQATGNEALSLRAPINGTIIEWLARPGQMVRTGEKLMAVADPSIVWLRINVYENDFRTLKRPVGARVNTNASPGGLILTEQDMRVLTTGGALDPVTRTIPVLLEVHNTTGRLTIHESTPVELYSSEGDTAVAVPETAVFEDGGLDVVFVQTEGESFEKRIVTVGPQYAGWVSILNGLKPGERAVTRGGYHVKLASTSAEIGHGHAH